MPCPDLVTERVLGRTQSVCPQCLRVLDAEYARSDDTVFLRKSCPQHGEFSAPVWRETPGAPIFAEWRKKLRIPAYPARPATATERGCPYDCGLCPAHCQHTCTALVEVTSRCSLACPVCYAGAGASGEEPPLAQIAAQLDTIVAAAGSCNLQISGGEPTGRADLAEIIALAAGRGFGLVQLNSNGLRLGNENGYAQQLKAAGLASVYLQFDGLDDEINLKMRGRPCLAQKMAAIDACVAAGLGVVLVCTLARGVNDAQIGQLLRWAVARGPQVRGLHFQPVASFGRFPWQLADAPRITLPEIMIALENQSGGMAHVADFHAPACEHALCSFSAVYERAGDGLSAPIGSSCCSGSDCAPLDNAEGSRKSRAFTATHWRGAEAGDQLTQPGAVARSFANFFAQAGASRRFTISAMAFQDAMTIDLERLRSCCIHVAAKDGRLIPFCACNLTSLNGLSLYRGKAC